MDQTLTKIEASQPLQKLKRVAAYARVSTGKEEQMNSLASQVSHYNSLISRTKGWEFAGIYADGARTGTKDNRPDFQRMLEDCRDGKIDMILCKSVSRFARNNLTFLQVTRELKSMGIDVYFQEENLHTLSNDGEMILTMIASFAEAESQSVSENMNWRIQKDFDQGMLWGGCDSYGYKQVNRKLVVDPKGAEIVRKVFDYYLSGLGTLRIAKKLNDEGYKRWDGTPFVRTTIQTILNNRNYTGDLYLQKTYREDFRTKKKKMNTGQRDMLIVKDDHEAIVSKEIYDLFISEKKKRARIYQKQFEHKDNRYVLTSYIYCGKCGKKYRHKTLRGEGRWTCITFNTIGAKYCNNQVVPEDKMNMMVAKSLGVSYLTSDIVKKNLLKVVVIDKYDIQVHMKNGTIVNESWEKPEKRSNWTPEMKAKASERAKQIYQRRTEAIKDA